MITRYKKPRCIANLVDRARKRKITIRVDKLTQPRIKVDRRKSASSTKHEIMDELKIALSNQIVRHPTHELGLYGCVAWKKLYLNKVNQDKHLNYIIMYEDRGMAFCKHVL